LLRQVSLRLEAETGVQEVARRHDASITVLDCKDLNKKDMAFLIDVSSPSRNTEEVITELKAKGLFKKVYAGESEGRPARSLCVAVLSRPGICQAVIDSGAFCLSCPYSRSDGDGKWRLLVKDSEQLKMLLAKLEDQAIMASIGELSEVKGGDRLTSRQSEILAKAISLGYFEFPRRFSLTELSKQVGIKPSTLSQVLRSAEEKVLTKYAAEMKINRVSLSSGELFTRGETESCAHVASRPTPFQNPNLLGTNAKRVSGG
jgi:predicted DNA binding protein